MAYPQSSLSSPGHFGEDSMTHKNNNIIGKESLSTVSNKISKLNVNSSSDDESKSVRSKGSKSKGNASGIASTTNSIGNSHETSLGQPKIMQYTKFTANIAELSCLIEVQ
jgi:hypothetical protein